MTIDVLVLLFILESVRISERSEGKLLRSLHILAVTFSVFVNFSDREYRSVVEEGADVVEVLAELGRECIIDEQDERKTTDAVVDKWECLGNGCVGKVGDGCVSRLASVVIGVERSGINLTEELKEQTADGAQALCSDDCDNHK